MENARKSLYLIVMTLSEVHIQRVHFEPEAPVLINLVMLMRVTNMETCNAKRVYYVQDRPVLCFWCHKSNHKTVMKHTRG